jgi:hypothetical protein
MNYLVISEHKLAKNTYKLSSRKLINETNTDALKNVLIYRLAEFLLIVMKTQALTPSGEFSAQSMMNTSNNFRQIFCTANIF